MHNEIAVYKHLESVRETYTKVSWHGYFASLLEVIILGDCGDRDVDATKDDFVSLLEGNHSYGVFHGDVARRNIVKKF